MLNQWIPRNLQAELRRSAGCSPEFQLNPTSKSRYMPKNNQPQVEEDAKALDIINDVAEEVRNGSFPATLLSLNRAEPARRP